MELYEMEIKLLKHFDKKTEPYEVCDLMQHPYFHFGVCQDMRVQSHASNSQA